MKPKITLGEMCHNALIFRIVLALFVYRLHFVFIPVFSLTCRCRMSFPHAEAREYGGENGGGGDGAGYGGEVVGGFAEILGHEIATEA